MKTITTKIAYTLEPVIIEADIPYGPAARSADTMENLSPDTWIYSPWNNIIQKATSAVNDTNDLGWKLEKSGFNFGALTVQEADALLDDPQRIVSLLTRKGWESVMDDPNVTVAHSVRYTEEGGDA